MAEASSSSDEGGFKCGKCRTTILIDNDGQLLLLDPINPENVTSDGSTIDCDESLWHLQTDSLPHWVTEAINQVRMLPTLMQFELRAQS